MEGGSGEDFAVEKAFANVEFLRPECAGFVGKGGRSGWLAYMNRERKTHWERRSGEEVGADHEELL